jgi:hypothetical protein
MVSGLARLRRRHGPEVFEAAPIFDLREAGYSGLIQLTTDVSDFVHEPVEVDSVTSQGSTDAANMHSEENPVESPLLRYRSVCLDQSSFPIGYAGWYDVKGHGHLLDCNACKAARLCAIGFGTSVFNISHRMRL